MLVNRSANPNGNRPGPVYVPQPKRLAMYQLGPQVMVEVIPPYVAKGLAMNFTGGRFLPKTGVAVPLAVFGGGASGFAFRFGFGEASVSATDNGALVHEDGLSAIYGGPFNIGAVFSAPPVGSGVPVSGGAVAGNRAANFTGLLISQITGFLEGYVNGTRVVQHTFDYRNGLSYAALMCVDPGTGAATLYRDTVQVATGTGAPANNVSTAAGLQIMIGAAGLNAGTGAALNQFIGDVRGLTILNGYAATQAGSPSGFAAITEWMSAVAQITPPDVSAADLAAALIA